MVRSPDIQGLTASLIASEYRSCWNVTITGAYPGETAATEDLEIGFENFHPIIRNVTRLFRGNYFRWDLITFVESTKMTSQSFEIVFEQVNIRSTVPRKWAIHQHHSLHTLHLVPSLDELTKESSYSLSR